MYDSLIRGWGGSGAIHACIINLLRTKYFFLFHLLLSILYIVYVKLCFVQFYFYLEHFEGTTGAPSVTVLSTICL